MRREKKNYFFIDWFFYKMKIRLIVPVIFGTFLFFGLIFPSQALIIAPTATVSGTVRDVITNQVIPDALVMAVETFTNSDCGQEFGEDQCFNNHYIFNQTQTNQAGSYNFVVDFCGMSLLLVVVKDGYINFEQTQNFACWSTQIRNISLTPDNPALPEPVIIVPGIMASWNRHLLDKNLEYADEWVLDPHFHTYDQLISDLQVYGGYVLGETLFTFPYDWRQANEFTAQLLQGEIQKIKNQTGAAKVDVIAHSMGGLVARYYIESNLYQNDIDQLIFIATPQRGAPKAYLAWEGGYLGTNLVSDFVKELLVAKIAKIDGFCDSLLDRNECVYNYIRRYPVATVQQLLPDYNYLRSGVTGDVFAYPDNYPRNEFLENLNSSVNLDKLYSSGIEISTIYNATPNSTVGELEVISRTQDQEPFWEHGYPDGFNSFNRLSGIILDSGDTTVPYSSALFINNENLITKLNTNHRKIVGISSQNVIEILKGEFIDIQVIDQPDEYVIIQVHSPVDILLTLPSGKQIGHTPSGDVLEVSDAYYSGSDAQNEYIVLPKKEIGNYNLTLVGTGAGEYQVEVSMVGDDKVDTQTFSGYIIPDVVLELVAEVDESTIMPILPQDQQSPFVTIESPTSTAYAHHEQVDVVFTATDQESGIASSTVLLDDIEFTVGTIDMFALRLGEHTLTISSSDWAGNRQIASSTFYVTANFTSVRADIERLFAQNDIKNLKTKKLLLKEVEWLEKSYAQLEKFIHKNHLPGVRLRGIRQTLAKQMIDNTLDKLLRKNLISHIGYDILKEQFMFIIYH